MTNRVFLPSLKKILLYVLLFVFLTPFLLIIMNSFKSTQQFVENPLSLPTSIQMANYVSAFDNMNFLDGFLNSLMITVGSVVLILFFPR